MKNTLNVCMTLLFLLTTYTLNDHQCCACAPSIRAPPVNNGGVMGGERRRRCLHEHCIVYTNEGMPRIRLFLFPNTMLLVYISSSITHQLHSHKQFVFVVIYEKFTLYFCSTI